MMRILFVVTNSALNRGMNTGLENLAWGLAERGIEIHVLSGGANPKSHKYGLPKNVYYHFTGLSGENEATFLNKYLEILKNFEIYIVVGWIINIALLTGHDESKNITFLANQGQIAPKSLFARYVKNIIRRRIGLLDAIRVFNAIKSFPSDYNKVISNSYAVQNSCIETYNLDPNNCHIVYRGIDTDIFKYEREYLKKNENFKILFVGNVYAVKGIDELIESINSIKTKIELVLCGNAKDSYIEKCEKSLDKVLNKFNYKGPLNRDKLLEEYQSCDLFVFPSHSEGMPKALLEAMSCGCPIVCSDIQPHKEVITNKHNGLLFKTKSSEDLAYKISRMIENDDLRKSCGSNAHTFIKENLSKKVEIDNWMSIIERYLGSKYEK